MVYKGNGYVAVEVTKNYVDLDLAHAGTKIIFKKFSEGIRICRETIFYFFALTRFRQIKMTLHFSAPDFETSHFEMSNDGYERDCRNVKVDENWKV